MGVPAKIIVTTDPNRQFLRVEYLDGNTRSINQRHAGSIHVADKVVYEEQFLDHDTATIRRNVLSGFTRMQLERLIRRTNPNWLHLHADLLPANMFEQIAVES